MGPTTPPPVIVSADELVRPLIKVSVMGIAGAGKSHFAGTFPKPMLVLLCDPDGKDTPYVERGIVLEPLKYGDLNQPVTRVMSLRQPDRELIRIEQFEDRTYDDPDGFLRLLSRLDVAAREVEQGMWRTIVLDGYSFAQFLAMEMRSRGQFTAPLDRRTQEPMVAAYATGDIERLVWGRLRALRCNVVMPCHIDEDRDEAHGKQLRNPKAPGRMRQGTTAAFPESYRVYTVTSPDGTIVRQLQTQPDNDFNCFSQSIHAPSPCWPDYNSLWPNWETNERAKRQKVAAILKGEATT
jgi:hypothetical protein